MELGVFGMALSQPALPRWLDISVSQTWILDLSVLNLPYTAWFFTYNYLLATVPVPEAVVLQLLRQGMIGFVASIASDTISNSLHVVKTYRQVNETRISYGENAFRLLCCLQCSCIAIHLTNAI
jgi:hypothetical protein